MNPRIIGIHVKGHNKKIKEIDSIMWHMGLYIQSAVAVAIEHNFAENPQSEYVKCPILQEECEEDSVTNKETNEECAVFEMQQRINLLRQQGLPESPI